MRRFTKTHNDILWLFPICKTKNEANKEFDFIEEIANYRFQMCYDDQKTFDKDDMIDAFMKGYSEATQMIYCEHLNRYINRAIGAEKLLAMNEKVIDRLKSKIEELENIVERYQNADNR